MATKQLLTCIGLLDLEQAFVEADEDLMPDLSVVRISMIRDVHYDSIDLKVLVYGQENGEEDAPVGEFRVDPEVVCPDGALAEGGINPSQLAVIFSKNVLGLFLALDTQIQWLCEDGYLLPLNLAQNTDNGVRLEPIDQ